MTTSLAEAPAYEQLAARFRPVFNRIAATAVERETGREPAYDAVAWLKQARFGALRVPAELGGLGADLGQTLRLLIELAAADSNLSQALRAHFSTVESRLVDPDPERRAHWLALAADGVIFGNATTERGNAKGTIGTKVSRIGGRLLLTGTKYYSTGTLYSDWIAVSAAGPDGEPLRVMVPADAPGVTLLDDWDGFGQRLTASGTTVFQEVEVTDSPLYLTGPEFRPPHLPAYVQLVLTSTLAGIGRAVLRDAVDYARARSRVFTHGNADTVREDPQVQAVIGQLAAISFAVDHAAYGAIDALAEVAEQAAAGTLDPDTVAAADIASSQAQLIAAEQVLRAATLLFDVGGASAVGEARRLDRHWRNARTIAQHNPTIYRAREVGNHFLNGTHQVGQWTVGA